MDGYQLVSPLENVLPEVVRLIARNGPAATVAACLLLKALFLALHLLALRPPHCSGLERLALLHWSFDVWNVWCLAVFVRTGRLPWGLETCVLYHVIGYLVYSLVYLYLQNREWAARDEPVSRLGGTPDSELTVRISEGEEEEDERAAALGGEPFRTPGPAATAVLSEDVPDEESAARDGEDAGQRQSPAAGRDALCAIPEDGVPVELGVGGDRHQGGLQQDRGQPLGQDGSPERWQPETSHATGRSYRKLDAAGEVPQRSQTATDGGRYMDVTQDVAAALKAGRPRDVPCGGPADADPTGFNKSSPVKAQRGKPVGPLGGKEEQHQQGGDEDQDRRQDETAEAEAGSETRNSRQHKLNGDHNGVSTEDQNSVPDGDHNGVPNRDENGAPIGDHNGVSGEAHDKPRNGDYEKAQSGDYVGP